MLGRRSSPLSLADADAWGKQIPSTWRRAPIREWSLTHWPDERFAAWYADDGPGRPSIPPSYLVTWLRLPVM